MRSVDSFEKFAREKILENSDPAFVLKALLGYYLDYEQPKVADLIESFPQAVSNQRYTFIIRNIVNSPEFDRYEKIIQKLNEKIFSVDGVYIYHDFLNLLTVFFSKYRLLFDELPQKMYAELKIPLLAKFSLKAEDKFLSLDKGERFTDFLEDPDFIFKTNPVEIPSDPEEIKQFIKCFFEKKPEQTFEYYRTLELISSYLNEDDRQRACRILLDKIPDINSLDDRLEKMACSTLGFLTVKLPLKNDVEYKAVICCEEVFEKALTWKNVNHIFPILTECVGKIPQNVALPIFERIATETNFAKISDDMNLLLTSVENLSSLLKKELKEDATKQSRIDDAISTLLTKIFTHFVEGDAGLASDSLSKLIPLLSKPSSQKLVYSLIKCGKQSTAGILFSLLKEWIGYLDYFDCIKIIATLQDQDARIKGKWQPHINNLQVEIETHFNLQKQQCATSILQDYTLLPVAALANLVGQYVI